MLALEGGALNTQPPNPERPPGTRRQSEKWSTLPLPAVAGLPAGASIGLCERVAKHGFL